MMSQTHLLDFELSAIDSLIKDGGFRQLCRWYWLTDGWYKITIGDEELFRYSNAWISANSDNSYTTPYVHYYAAQLWDSVRYLWPAIMEPIPLDIWSRVSTLGEALAMQRAADRWLEASERQDAWDVYYNAVAWYDSRRLDTAPIWEAPSIWFIRVGESIRVRWDARRLDDNGVQIWSSSVGEHEMSIVTLLDEVRSFHDRLMTQMWKRIETVNEVYASLDPAVDVPALRREHVSREGALRAAQAGANASTDWDQVRRALAVLSI